MVDIQTKYGKSTIIFNKNPKPWLLTISWIISNLAHCQVGLDENVSLYISKNHLIEG